MRDVWKLRLVVALSAGLGVPAVTSAQFDPGRAGREGPGFKTGRLVLHPGFEVEGGYDSNVFLQDQNEEDAFILRLTGYLDVATEPPIRQREGEGNQPEPQKITFRGGLGVSYYYFFNDRVRPNASADAHVDFSYNPSQVFSLQIRDTFVRTVRPFTNPNTRTGQTTSYGRNLNTASLDLVGRSKSRVLEGKVGYTNVLEFFDSDVFNYGNNITHRVPARLNWSFFPSSAVFYEARYDNQQFDPTRVNNSVALLSNSNRVRNSVGFNGALTETLSLTLSIGYAAGFYEFGDNFDGVIARVEARYRPRARIALTGGYNRDYVPSFIGNFMLENRLYLRTAFTLSGAMQLGIQGSVSFNESGLALASNGTLLGNQPYWKGVLALVGLFAEYRFKAWLSVFARTGWIANFTDFEYVGPEPLIDPAAGYQKFDAWIGLRIFY
jgi:hypothetical protein